jgi:transketolase
MSIDSAELSRLEKIARTIRRDIVEMVHAAGSGHPGGSLSSADFVAALYFSRLRHKPEDPCWEDRDRVVFSKGHVAPVLYSALARSGYFPVEQLTTLRKLGSMLQGHPATCCPGVEVGTGSLGQGISVAVGLALAAKRKNKDFRVYTILGDGELQEGQVWEAAMSAAHFRLNNLIAFVDYNHLQIDGAVSQVMEVADLRCKWESFNWNPILCNGHDMEQLVAALDEAKRTRSKPSVIIGDTVKGKGVSFMEDQPGWHGRAPNAEELALALAELAEPEDAS